MIVNTCEMFTSYCIIHETIITYNNNYQKKIRGKNGIIL